jgi:low temperature requirement protein LtrA
VATERPAITPRLDGRSRIRVAGDGHRVTTFELFFDLVFVFAVTQISSYVAREHSPIGVLRGAVLLGLLWWAWSSYAWLGNQAHADVGIIRLGMVVAMTLIFVVALTIPEAWHDTPGGLDAPIVLAGAYIGIRLVHEALYAVAAGDDPGLRHQLVLNLLPLSVSGALLVVGAAAGDGAQTGIWALALALDWLLTYVTSMRGGGWRIHSVEHWVERHGLVVILAIGESIVAIGAGASGTPVSWSLIGGAVLGILISTLLWWLYFDVSAEAAERALHRRDETQRVRAAIESYTYLHFGMVFGIVLTAVGVEEALAHATDDVALGAFAAGCLCLGPATYLAAHVLSWIRLDRVLKVQRAVATAVLLGAWPLATALVPLAALTIVTVVLGALVGWETVRYADLRAEIVAART